MQRNHRHPPGDSLSNVMEHAVAIESFFVGGKGILTEKIDSGGGKGIDSAIGERERFSSFHTIFHFDEFCMTRLFEFFSSVLTKNLEMDSNFL
jgi:hypothetical protein